MMGIPHSNGARMTLEATSRAALKRLPEGRQALPVLAHGQGG